jgi:hypothetical protein
VDTMRSEDEVARAWRALGALYLLHPSDPVIAGARAAAEWTTVPTLSPAPITLERVAPTLDRARDESHHAAMVELGISPGSVEYARGVAGWMFWWTGLRPLPPWLRRAATAA